MENPLAVSNSASIKDGISLLITNGNAPINETYIQDRDTIIKPSLEKNTVFLGFKAITNIVPITALAPIVIANAHQQLSDRLAANIIGSTINAANTNATLPKELKIIR